MNTFTICTCGMPLVIGESHVCAGPLAPLPVEALDCGTALSMAMDELVKAREKWPKFNSAHEGYGVLLEEVDELWEHVKVNQKRRDLHAMRKEAIQIAAMALRFAVEVCDDTNGRK
jgi:NTP pyrophosphatase (non-canonical NTP hydrolase)